MGMARLNISLPLVLCFFFGLAVALAAAAQEEPPQAATARASIDEAVRLREAGQLTLAVQSYQQALQLEPDNTEALYGLADTYVKQRRYEEAIPPLQKAIEKKPAEGAPYLLLGQIYRHERQPVQGLFFFMRFVALEADSEQIAKVGDAATGAFELLTSNVSKDSTGIVIGIDPELRKHQGDFAPLEVGRRLIAATVYDNEENKRDSQAKRHVTALTAFVEMAEGMSRSKKGKTFTAAFTWQKAAGPIVGLQKRGVLEAFGYLLASRAGLAGGKEWLDAHPQKVQEMEFVLQEINPVEPEGARVSGSGAPSFQVSSRDWTPRKERQ